MVDLSLGPLRIANPDDTSPEATLQPQISNVSMPAVSPLGIEERQTDYIGIGEVQSRTSPVSPLRETQVQDIQVSYPAPSAQSVSQPNSIPRKQTVDRNQRQSMGYTYQDQQQSQFPQYATMMPQNMHDSRMNTSRPGSTYYTQVPVNTTANGIVRQGSYRTRSDGNGGSLAPQRTSSKRSPAPSGAGMARDDGQTDRYRQTPPQNRRITNPVSSTRSGSMPTSSAPLSTTPNGAPSALANASNDLDNGGALSSEDWRERGAAVGMQRSYDANGQPVLRPIKKGVKDFNFGQTLGEGSYSTVLAATDRQTLKEYAIKVLDKRHIIKEKKVKYVNIEKETLNRLTDHPGVVRLYYTFQDERSLYFVLDLCSGGELLGVLKRMTTFDEECTKFYGAQILDTIEYMHSKGVIHRDLKPENVLLDENKHIKITDFGTAKMLPAHNDETGRTTYEADSSPLSAGGRAGSFVGTAEYVSPELLTDKNACKGSDLWAFGCIIYQLLAGRPPFKAANEFLTFQKIVALDYEFPRGFPEVARDLVERLLVLEPPQRLTMEHVKSHPFFEGIKWGKTLWQQKAPRLKAYVPPPNPPIKLNGSANSYPPDIAPAHSTHATILPPSEVPKPQPRVITELPPPSQLDIEWSPVLTRDNERILKLGNLNVLSSPLPHSPGHEGGSKLSRFFGGSTTKKRQRLVMVTSSARIIIAAAGGDEKKSKMEIGLLAPGTEISSSTDAKGVTQWVVNTVSQKKNGSKFVS